MRSFHKTLIISVLSLALTAGLFSNGLSLNGVGSRASAMGTAYVGLADDWSAVFFNPAGLIQMKEDNLSLFITNIMPSGTYKSDDTRVNVKETNGTLFIYSLDQGAFKRLQTKPKVL